MHLPPFLLDHWLAQHEFAHPPIRYNLASSTGPKWTHGQLLDLDDGKLRDRLRELPISYSPPEGDRALREQIARLHTVDPDWVIVTTGASEALSVVLCLASEAGASVALPASPTTLIAGSGRRAAAIPSRTSGKSSTMTTVISMKSAPSDPVRCRLALPSGGRSDQQIE